MAIISQKNHRMLQWAGLLAWLAVGLDHFHQVWADPRLMLQPGRQLCTLAYLLFAAVYLPTFRRDLSQRASVLLLALATLIAVWLTYYPYGAFSALFVVTAARAGLHIPRVARLWLAGQIGLSGAVFFLRPDMTGFQALSAWVMFATFEAFALFAAEAVQSEAEAREALAEANTRLLVAQPTLVQSSRTEERLEISRELHDSVGHHLTALALRLEVIVQIAQDRVAVEARQAREQVVRLLAEVREVVSALREESRDDLSRRLTLIAEPISMPRVHLQLPEGLEVDNRQVARTVYRCVQEIVTNAVRHAQAQNLWIELFFEDAGIGIRARDDGRGAATLVSGNGLSGMRERLATVGGSLELGSATGRGMSVEAWIPLRPSLPAGP